jgi:hypothetical protein
LINEQHTRLRSLERRIERVQAQLDRMRRRSDRLVRVRLGGFVTGVLVSLAAFLLIDATAFWVTVFLAIIAFAIIVAAHRRINAAIQRHEVWLWHQRAQVARLRLDWAHIPPAFAAQPIAQHPFAADLNLCGDRSLHHLLNTAVTVEGSQRLADWLINPRPDARAIHNRQALVRELRPLAHFRDRLILNGALASGDPAAPWQTTTLLEALAPAENPAKVRRLLIVMAALSALTLAFFALNTNGALPPLWALTWPIYVLLFVLNQGKIKALFDAVFDVENALQRMRQVFRYLERQQYAGIPNLKELCASFLTTQRPSDYLRRVTGVLTGASIQGNLFLWLPINLIVPWDFYFAYRLRQCQAELSERMPIWLNAWHELEALSSLANYGDLNPSTVLPMVSADRAPLHAIQLGHPLIPAETRVSNDFDVADAGHVALITGSNMSGKSSFLRALGTNLCLAYAGGPVCATELQAQPFRLYTCIAVSDSVVDGISYFYAEVKRLKQLLDALQAGDDLPLFFLIDEIFRGTNNRERLIGSRAYLRALVGRHGVGVISTHDLELTRLPGEMPQLANYHFKEHITDRQMVFDYLLRPGPSPSTNALRIMELEGLPVDAQS